MDINFDSFLQIANFGAIVAFLYLFLTAKIVPEKTVDRILDEAEKRSSLVATQITEDMAKAVEKGVLAANAKMNGKDV